MYSNLTMSVKRLSICLPKEVVKDLDAAASADHTSRSAYIKEAIVLRMRLDSHVEHETLDKNSYYNVLRAARLGKMIKRNINQH